MCCCHVGGVLATGGLEADGCVVVSAAVSCLSPSPHSPHTHTLQALLLRPTPLLTCCTPSLMQQQTCR